jgi:DNA-directed RNA polymerase specialized sigma24 family protein
MPCSGGHPVKKWRSETERRASGTVGVMEADPSDVDCLARSLSEPEAFKPIFDRHFGPVHRYLHRRAGRELADELAAETFALAFERRASCRPIDSALPWLYGIATNLLRRRWRTERQQLRAFARRGADRWADCEDDAAARVDGTSLDAGFARALAAMRPQERDAAAALRPRRPQLRRNPRSRSTSRSGRSARGCTARARPPNASSRRRRQVSLS